MDLGKKQTVSTSVLLIHAALGWIILPVNSALWTDGGKQR